MPGKSNISKTELKDKVKQQAKLHATSDGNVQKSNPNKETKEYTNEVDQDRVDEEIAQSKCHCETLVQCKTHCLVDQDVIRKVFEKAKDNPNDWTKCDTVRLERSTLEATKTGTGCKSEHKESKSKWSSNDKQSEQTGSKKSASNSSSKASSYKTKSSVCSVSNSGQPNGEPSMLNRTHMCAGEHGKSKGQQKSNQANQKKESK